MLEQPGSAESLLEFYDNCNDTASVTTPISRFPRVVMATVDTETLLWPRFRIPGDVLDIKFKVNPGINVAEIFG